jgi:DNA-binding response OmpR family regulator
VADLGATTRPDCPLVLIADDEPDILELVRMVLEEEGYEVATADNGATALRLANERRPDLCVLDVMMPQIDGYDVARVMKRDEELRTIPVILLTARTEPENVARGREAGADEYIAKPFLPDEFQHAVRSVLSARPIPVEPEPVAAPTPTAGAAVLLAGGNPALINVARYRLELGGYEVTTAGDPAHAIEVAVETLPDVFVLDVATSNLNAAAVAQLLREHGAKETAFLTLSNGGPFDPQDLFTRIQSALAR